MNCTAQEGKGERRQWGLTATEIVAAGSVVTTGIGKGSRYCRSRFLPRPIRMITGEGIEIIQGSNTFAPFAFETKVPLSCNKIFQ